MRMSLIWTFSDPEIERFMKWLMGRTDVEDALQRLDKMSRTFGGHTWRQTWCVEVY